MFLFDCAGGGQKAKAKVDRSRKQALQQKQQQQQSTPVANPSGGEDVPGSGQGDSTMSVRYSRVTSGDGPGRSGANIFRIAQPFTTG